MPLPDLHNFQILKFVHKFIHHQDQLPDVYFYYFNKNRILHYYNTLRPTKDALHSKLKVLSFGTLSLKNKRQCYCDKIVSKIKILYVD